MKLEKAIEHGSLISHNLRGALGYEGVKAIQLLIEAGKFRLELEQEDPEITLRPLPGETAD